MKVQIAGQTVTVEPVRVKELPKFLAAVEPLARELVNGDILAALAGQAERVIEAVAIGAGVERAWLEAQTPEALIELASAVLEVNADFFVQRVVPRIEALASKLTQTASGGTSGLPGSAQQDSATTR